MDFIKILPVELSEFVLQHLTTRELLSVSLVSKSWNKFIGESSNLMKNIKFVFDLINKRFPLTTERKQILIDSPRVYQHLELCRVDASFIQDIFDIYKSKNNQMRTLKLHDVHFNFTKDLTDFIGLFKLTIEEIIFGFIHVKISNEFDCDEFENLKVLHLFSYESINCSNIFEKCKNLIELQLIGRSPEIQSIQPIVTILQQNEKLKFLDLSLEIGYQIFENKEILSKISFKLHKFQAKIWSKTCFNEFLKTQVDSIQNLKLHRIDFVEDLETIFKMENLKSVDLGIVEDLNLSNINLTINPNIEHLEFYDMGCKITTARPIITAAPNTKNMKIFWMTQEIMEHVAVKMKYLEYLTMFVPLSYNMRSFPTPIDSVKQILKSTKIKYVCL